MHELEYKSNADEMWPVVEMLMILNFLEQLVSNSRKLKIITISITAYITSAFNLYSNPCTYLEAFSSDPSYTGFSIPFDEHNLSKKSGRCILEVNKCMLD